MKLMKKTSLKKYCKWFLSPTLYISDHYKAAAKDVLKRGERVKRLNKTYFAISLLLLLWIAIWSRLPYNRILNITLIIYPIYLVARCNEIFMAFMKDAFDKLNPAKREENGLKYYERIQLALRSYAELVINYAILYYILDRYFMFYRLGQAVFNKSLETILDAVYFSVITIVAIGYGEYFPVHQLSKILVMYEVISGTLLLVVSFTVYVNLDLKD